MGLRPRGNVANGALQFVTCSRFGTRRELSIEPLNGAHHAYSSRGAAAPYSAGAQDAALRSVSTPKGFTQPAIVGLDPAEDGMTA